MDVGVPKRVAIIAFSLLTFIYIVALNVGVLASLCVFIKLADP
jgi:hypothetical protein